MDIRWEQRFSNFIKAIDKLQQSVDYIHKKFNENDIPYDVIWLDIEHTDDKKYFTWDKTHFPTPLEMQKNIENNGRKVWFSS